MKALRIAAFAALALLYAACANAQVNDPVIRTGGGNHSVAVTSPFFRIGSPSGNSPALTTVPNSTDCVLWQPGKASTSVPGCFFKNNITLPGGTGITITRLVFVVENDNYTGVLTCGTDTTLGKTGPFAACSVQPVGDGTFSIVAFFNGSVPYGTDFSMGMRGFNSNASFAGIALRRNPETAELYEFPDGAPRKSDFYAALNSAPRSLGCETCQSQALSGFHGDRRAFDAASTVADAGKMFQSSVWNSSNRPNLDGMPGASPIAFKAWPTEAWPTSGHEWRIT